MQHSTLTLRPCIYLLAGPPGSEKIVYDVWGEKSFNWLNQNPFSYPLK